MRSAWYGPITIETLANEKVWNSSPESPGVYIIMGDRPIRRIGGDDAIGTLYVGKAKNLRNRLWAFWKASHSASGFLWTHPQMARIVLDKPIRTVTDVEKHLGKLRARYSTPIDEHYLDNAERAIIFAYIHCFGEAPPLNLSLPNRWAEPPGAQDLRWAERALLKEA